MGFEGRITFFPFLLCFVSKKKNSTRGETRSVLHPTPILPHSPQKNTKKAVAAHTKKKEGTLYFYLTIPLSRFSHCLSPSLSFGSRKRFNSLFFFPPIYFIVVLISRRATV